MSHNKFYWNTRYSEEGKIWGELPSKSAFYFLELIKKYQIKSILVPGSGYGRHSKYFSDIGYKVVGIELSDAAFKIAKKFDPLTKFICGSILEMDNLDKKFDAIFCFNTLHLFLKEERTKVLNNCYNILNHKGFVFFTVFSEKELSFGKGKEIERYTYESKPGRPTHYFTEADLAKDFKELNLLEQGIIEEQENHGTQGFHTHFLRYIFAQKDQ